jgi:electron transfer flavoprotein beta subunit
VKVHVTVKPVMDFSAQVCVQCVQADGSGVDLANAKMSMNPLDGNALEEAIRLKGKGVATGIIIVSTASGRRRKRCKRRWRWVLTARS